jgi:hypothetical protein
MRGTRSVEERRAIAKRLKLKLNRKILKLFFCFVFVSPEKGNNNINEMKLVESVNHPK